MEISSYYRRFLEKWTSCVTDEQSGDISFKKVAFIATWVFASVAGVSFIAGELAGRVSSFVKNGLKLGLLSALGTVSLSFFCRDDLIAVPEDLYNHKGAVKRLSNSQLVQVIAKGKGGHEVAKKTFTKALKTFNLSVDFVSPPENWDLKMGRLRSTSEEDEENVSKTALSSFFSSSSKEEKPEPLKPLDKKIFQFSELDSVQEEINKVSGDKEQVHLFSVTSTYSGGDIKCENTLPIGKAISTSKEDSTSATAIQRANPVVFEIANACLSHLGFNMLEKYPSIKGKTLEFCKNPLEAASYPRGRSDAEGINSRDADEGKNQILIREGYNSDIQNGRLKFSEQNAVRLYYENERNFRQVEVPCYESKIAPDKESFFLIMGASPTASNISSYAAASCFDSFQYESHLAIFAAQFNQVQALLDKNPNKKIVFHVTDIFFGGTPPLSEDSESSEESSEEAFLRAANLFEASLSEADKQRVSVQIDAYPQERKTQREAAQYLGLLNND